MLTAMRGNLPKLAALTELNWRSWTDRLIDGETFEGHQGFKLDSGFSGGVMKRTYHEHII